MFNAFSATRQTATALAAAFITSLLFVTAAVGPIPIA